MSREAMQQALEALEQDNPAGRTATIAALRAALAEPEPEYRVVGREGMSREAMQQALEALECVTRQFTRTPSTLADSEARGEAHKAMDALRAALAEQAQPVADAARVIEWATSTPRKAAVNAFTEGPERQAAYWIEWAEARVVNRRLTTEQAQPVAECIDDICSEHSGRVEAFDHLPAGTKLYTTPPAPVVPQPLTDEDIHLITGHCGVSKHAAISIARAVEAAVLERMGVQR